MAQEQDQRSPDAANARSSPASVPCVLASTCTGNSCCRGAVARSTTRLGIACSDGTASKQTEPRAYAGAIAAAE